MKALQVLRLLAPCCLLFACEEYSSFSETKEAWNQENDPVNFHSDDRAGVGQYNYTFEELPLAGRVTKLPWAGDYWPTHRGGISFRWYSDKSIEESYSYDLIPFEALEPQDIMFLSPAEKYDLYLGDRNYTLTRFERQRTQILKTVASHESYDPSFEIPNWEGLCHAWAPAALHFEYPKAVTMVGRLGHEIPFGSSDIQALLAMFVDQSSTEGIRYIGDRCDVNFAELEAAVKAGEISEIEKLDIIHSSECRDSNAGSFHLALANDIGRAGRGFVMDVTRDDEVWNHPVSSYESRVVGRSKGASRGAAEGTVEEVSVETLTTYIGAGDYSFDEESPETHAKTILYRYRLELDSKGQILGGAWLNGERPDFLWRMAIPEFSGAFEPLGSIYRESVRR